MARLIDADTLCQKLLYQKLSIMVAHDDGKDPVIWITASGLKRIIDDMPTVDAVPVIRCDDCIYRDGKIAGQPNILCWHMHADDFCSYGTRKEEGKDNETD